ncbi:MAG: APC family permease [Acidaminobacteraceae bacterium]
MTTTIYNERKNKNKNSLGLTALISLGISCTFGASWLVMGGIWLEEAGGPINAIISFIIYTAIILVIAKSYLKISHILPKAMGEADYAKAAFGNKASFLAGWSSLLVNTLLCAWQSISISKMLGYLLKDKFTFKVLYIIGGYEITTFSLALGIILIFIVAGLQIKGNSSLVKLSMAISIIVFVIVLITMIFSFKYFSIDNLTPIASKPIFEGTMSLMVILPFSIAGWETIAKGSAASNSSDPKLLKRAMYSSILISSFLYLFILIYQAGILPWQTNISEVLPYVSSLRQVMKNNFLGLLIIIAAAFNIVGVYNGMLFGAVKSLVLLSQNGYLPESLTKVSPKTKTHVNAILTISSLILFVPFIGEAAFKPVINATAFIYILLWLSTVISCIKLNNQKKESYALITYLKNPSLICVSLLGFAMILPFSPGALSIKEFVMVLSLYAFGMIVYILHNQYKFIKRDRGRRIKFNYID